MHKKCTFTGDEFLAGGFIVFTLKIKTESCYKLHETQENIPLKIHGSCSQNKLEN